MARFYIDMDGDEPDEVGVDVASLDEARNEAIVRLGGYLRERPDFAYRRHWRVDVKDHAHRLMLHVIVATVVAPPPINRDSFDPPQAAGG